MSAGMGSDAHPDRPKRAGAQGDLRAGFTLAPDSQIVVLSNSRDGKSLISVGIPNIDEISMPP